MSYNTLPIDVDKEKLRYLLDKFSNGTLHREEAKELIPLLERIFNGAARKGDKEFASKVAEMIIALNGYVQERIGLVDDVSISDRVDAKKIGYDNNM